MFFDNDKIQNNNNPIPTPILSFLKALIIITSILAIIPTMENIIPTSEVVLIFFIKITPY